MNTPIRLCVLPAVLILITFFSTPCVPSAMGQDTIPPTIVSVTASTGPSNTVVVTFSEPVTNAGFSTDYSLSGNVEVSAATQDSPTTVTLSTGPLLAGPNIGPLYALTLSTNIQDLAGNPVAFGTQKSFTANTGTNIVVNTTIDTNSPGIGAASLREAIIGANRGAGPDTIVLPAGTYTLTITGPDENASATGDLDITDDLTVLGAGDGLTFIDAVALGDRIFHVIFDTNHVTIRDLTIQNGNAVSASGGGVLNAGDLQLQSVTISNCWAFRGGGVATTGTQNTFLRMTNCSVVGNLSDRGGGIYATGEVQIDNTVFDGVSEGIWQANEGGAICIDPPASALVRNSSFRWNTANRGGAVYCAGSLVLDRCTFSTNGVWGSTWNGSGFDTTNTATGGALLLSGAQASATNCTFSSNFARVRRFPGSFSGGAVAIDSVGNSVTLISCTLANNVVTSSGAAIYNSEGATNFTLGNTLVAYPSGTSNFFGPLTSLGYNLSSDASGPSGPSDLLNTDPLLGPLQDNGGFTLTHALLPGSPAIDAGYAAGLTTDQRGSIRPSDIPGIVNAVDGSDIGAFELLNNPPTLTSVSTLPGAVEDTDFPISYATLTNAADEADMDDGDTLSFRVEGLISGTLTKDGIVVDPGMTLLGPGESLVWRAATNANGVLNAFTVKAWDGALVSADPPVTVLVDVTESNDPPVAVVDSRGAVEDTPLTFAAIDLTTNDLAGPANESGQVLTVTRVSATSTQGGTVSLVGGVVTYTPGTNYAGSDSFMYTVQDNGTTGGVPDPKSAMGTVSVMVMPVNDAPVRTGGVVTNLTVLEDSGLTSLGLGAVSYSPGPPDESGQQLTNTVAAVPPPSLGQVVLADGITVVAANTSYTLAQIQGMQFRTATNANGGPAGFSYWVQDNGGTTNGGADTLLESLAITVTATNDAPVFTVGGDVSVDEDSGAYFSGQATGIDDGDPEVVQSLTFNVANNNNSLFSVQPTIAANGTLNFTPAPDANGSALVTVSLTDDATAGGAALTTADQTFTVNVNPVNDPPSFQLVQEDGQAFAGTLRLPANFLGKRFLLAVLDQIPGEFDLLVTYRLEPPADTYTNVDILLDSTNGRIRFTAVANGIGTNDLSLIATDDGGATWTNTFSLELSAEPTIVDAPVSYCVNYPENGSTNVLFTVLAGGVEPLDYQWEVNGTNVPSLNHRALKLPLPGFPLPKGTATVEVTVMVSNTNGWTNASATVTLDPVADFPTNSTFNPLIVVTNGGATNLTVNYTNSDATFEWRYNGIRLTDRTNVFMGTTNNTLQLTNIWATPAADPLLATNSQVGLYQAIIRPTTGCTNVAWFEVEISSRITTNSAPHSVDNPEDLEPLTNTFSSSSQQSSVARVADLGGSGSVRAGIGIQTVPRSEEFQYLSLFASTHQEHEAELFHAVKSTNGFSQWFALRPANTNINQLVTLDVAGSPNLTNIVLVVYARSRPTEPVSITNLELITRFDSFKDPTRPPAGGTNAVVTFETKTRPEFVVVVDMITSAANMDVRVNWSTDPFPTNDFQWLKVVLPGRTGRLDVAATSTNKVYFAFASVDTNYSTLARLETDWAAWEAGTNVAFMCMNVREVYLLTDLLPYRPSEIHLTNNATELTNAGLEFVFSTNAVAGMSAPLRIVQDGDELLILWEGDSQVETAPSPTGPWEAIPTPTGTNHQLRLPADRPSHFYRLAPPRTSSLIGPVSSRATATANSLNK